MAERRRYPARDLTRARRKLRTDAETLAERGLRPAWMVWVPVRRGWWRRQRGELVVQFEPVGAQPGRSAPGSMLQPLWWRLHQLLAEQAAIEEALQAAGPGARPDLARSRRRLEASVREVELELTRLESLS